MARNGKGDRNAEGEVAPEARNALEIASTIAFTEKLNDVLNSFAEL